MIDYGVDGFARLPVALIVKDRIEAKRVPGDHAGPFQRRSLGDLANVNEARPDRRGQAELRLLRTDRSGARKQMRIPQDELDASCDGVDRTNQRGETPDPA